MNNHNEKFEYKGMNLFDYTNQKPLSISDEENVFSSTVLKQEGQVALNLSPEFCLKLTYSYLLKADHVPGDTWDRNIFAPGAVFEQTW